jgi:hypothetical protein
MKQGCHRIMSVLCLAVLLASSGYRAIGPRFHRRLREGPFRRNSSEGHGDGQK